MGQTARRKRRDRKKRKVIERWVAAEIYCTIVGHKPARPEAHTDEYYWHGFICGSCGRRVFS